MDIINNFNGISLIAIIALSYFAVLKNTKHASYEKKQVAMNRHYQ